MVSCQEPPPWKGANILSSVTPMTQCWWMYFPLCPWGWRQGFAPVTALHIADEEGTLPLSLLLLPWMLPLCPHCHCHLCCCCCWRCHSLLPLLLPLAIAAAVAVTHHRCCLWRVSVSHRHCRGPCRRPLPSPSLLAIAVAISIGHQHCCCHHPLPRVVALAWQELYLNNLSK